MAENIGQKIKQIREENQLSLSELAAEIGIHHSQLSMIEEGQLSPSIVSLVRISRALGTRLGTILDGAESTGPAINRKQDSKPSVRLISGDSKVHSHMHFYALAQDKADRNMEPFHINVGYQAPEASKLSNHEGEEFLYVLDGTVTLYYGSESYVLHNGDSIYYDSIVDHLISTPSESETATILAVTYIPY